MEHSNSDIQKFFSDQLATWELARKNFEALREVQTKSFALEDGEVLVQYNPARIKSTAAKTDKQSIALRPCFLCAVHRPAEQFALDLGNYEILVNPYPIFPEHFTIPHKQHIPQEILPHLADMLHISQIMSDYIVFYNGPRCGASAPDHLHFQAGSKFFLPLANDIRAKTKSGSQSSTYKSNNRTCFIISSEDKSFIIKKFEKRFYQLKSNSEEEALMNIICWYEDKCWTLVILPRNVFRPWQYNATGNQQLLISPATVEMCGVLICPIENDFNKINKNDILDIYQQVSLQNY